MTRERQDDCHIGDPPEASIQLGIRMSVLRHNSSARDAFLMTHRNSSYGCVSAYADFPFVEVSPDETAAATVALRQRIAVADGRLA